MNFEAKPDKYYLLLSEDLYYEFCDLATRCNDFLLKSKSGIFSKEEGFYIMQVSKTEYCMILIQIKHLDRKSPLIKKMTEQGLNQDPDFQCRMDQIERDSRRYNLLNH